MSDLIYTFDEVVELTKGLIARDWLDRNARAGTFEHVHVGRNRGLTPPQLAALLQQHTRTPAAPKAVDLPTAQIESLTARSRARHARAAR
jgi:hypothetical protein